MRLSTPMDYREIIGIIVFVLFVPLLAYELWAEQQEARTRLQRLSSAALFLAMTVILAANLPFAWHSEGVHWAAIALLGIVAVLEIIKAVRRKRSASAEQPREGFNIAPEKRSS